MVVCLHGGLVLSEHVAYHGAVVGCIDGHWTDVTLAVVRRLAGGHRIDPYNRPGATLRHKRGCHVTEEVIEDLARITIANHGAMNLFLAHHQNCLAYGGSRAFASLAEEKAAHIADLRTAQQLFSEAVLDKVRQLLRSGHRLSRREQAHLEVALSGGFKVTGLFIPEANRGEVLSIKLADCQALVVDD